MRPLLWCGLALISLSTLTHPATAVPATAAAEPAGSVASASLYVSDPRLQRLGDELQAIALEVGSEAEVGVALIVDGRDVVTVNNAGRYPLMSVMKFHQALAVAHYLMEHELSLDTMIEIKPEALKPNTYSPLRDKYPQGNIKLPISELLRYTLQLSDNNACDILFDFIGGPQYVDKYLRSLGASSFAIVATEDDMHQDLERSYSNWSTPLESATLMERLIAPKIHKREPSTLSQPLPLPEESLSFIRETLLGCTTGMARLPAGLVGSDAAIGHKTGTSDQNAAGRYYGINDVGFVIMPDNSHYTLAVFVKDSALSMEESEQIIAKISKKIFEELSRQSSAEPVL